MPLRRRDDYAAKLLRRIKKRGSKKTPISLDDDAYAFICLYVSVNRYARWGDHRAPLMQYAGRARSGGNYIWNCWTYTCWCITVAERVCVCYWSWWNIMRQRRGISDGISTKPIRLIMQLRNYVDGPHIVWLWFIWWVLGNWFNYYNRKLKYALLNKTTKWASLTLYIFFSTNQRPD